MNKPDFVVHWNGDRDYQFRPLSDAAYAWVEEHLPEDAPRWGRDYVIRDHYAEAVLDGIERDGLTVVLHAPQGA